MLLHLAGWRRVSELDTDTRLEAIKALEAELQTVTSELSFRKVWCFFVLFA